MSDRGWNWHIWEKHPSSGKPFKYVGAMNTDTEALTWKRENETEHKKFMVNNIGPGGIAKAVGNAGPRPQRTVQQSSPTAMEAMRVARQEAARKDRERQEQNAAKKAERDARTAEDRKVMAGVVKDAEGLLEQHKADEQADLEQGINH